MSQYLSTVDETIPAQYPQSSAHASPQFGGYQDNSTKN